MRREKRAEVPRASGRREDRRENKKETRTKIQQRRGERRQEEINNDEETAKRKERGWEECRAQMQVEQVAT